MQHSLQDGVYACVLALHRVSNARLAFDVGFGQTEEARGLHSLMAAFDVEADSRGFLSLVDELLRTGRSGPNQ